MNFIQKIKNEYKNQIIELVSNWHLFLRSNSQTETNEEKKTESIKNQVWSISFITHINVLFLYFYVKFIFNTFLSLLFIHLLVAAKLFVMLFNHNKIISQWMLQNIKLKKKHLKLHQKFQSINRHFTDNYQ